MKHLVTMETKPKPIRRENGSTVHCCLNQHGEGELRPLLVVPGTVLLSLWKWTQQDQNLKTFCFRFKVMNPRLFPLASDQCVVPLSWLPLCGAALARRRTAGSGGIVAVGPALRCDRLLALSPASWATWRTVVMVTPWRSGSGAGTGTVPDPLWV